MKKITLLLLITFNLQLVTSFAQQSKIDSLKHIITTTEHDSTRIITLLELANEVYYSNPDTAIIICENVLSLSEKINFTTGLSNSYGWLGYLVLQKGNTNKALEYFILGLEIEKAIGNKEDIASSLNNIGYIYETQGYVKKALKYHKKALKIRIEIGDKSGIAYSLNNLGYIFDKQGELPKALEFYKRSLKIREDINDKQNSVSVLNNIGQIYYSQGNLTKALEYYEKCLLIEKTLKHKRGIASSYINIASLYNKMSVQLSNTDTLSKDSLINKALKYNFESLDIYERLGNNNDIAFVLNNIGLIYYYKAEYTKALDYYKRSLVIREKTEDKKGVALAFHNISYVYYTQAKFSEAESYAIKAYKLRKELGFPDDIKLSAVSLKGIYRKLNEYKKAKSFALKVIDINNKAILLNFPILSEKEKEMYFSTIVEDYMGFNSFSLNCKIQDPSIVGVVYNNTIKNKGLLLKSSTAMRNAILNSNDTILISRYKEWLLLREDIVKFYEKGEEIKSIEEQANEIEKELVKGSQVFSNFNQTQKISWKDIQTNLKENEVAIEFIHFIYSNANKWTDTTIYCALVVAPKSKYPEMIPLFEEKQLEEIIGKFGGNNYSYINSIYGKNTEVNKELYNLIWKPMEKSLKGAKKVYLSPSGLLHKISFSAIAKRQNVYLCDAYDIEVKSSTAKITEDSKNPFNKINKISATLFGGIIYDTDSTKQKVWSYLEGTKTETEKIDKILKKGDVSVDYYSNISATEEEFKLMASNSNILHIATHGFFYPDPKEVEDETKKEVEHGKITFRGGSRGFGVNSFVENDNPLMRSGLVFAGANNVWSKQNKNDSIDDGVLTAQEVSNIDMRKTNLVVMSACETGLGDIKGSEGVYGLQRAFKMAGVDYMIMSLWQVPDKETEEFMTSFYKKLIKQKDIEKAFAKTQKEMRRKYDPYFWAAFILVQ